MLEFLFEPIINTIDFGCPEDCVVTNSDYHIFLKTLFMPITLIGISAGVTFGILVVTRKLKPLLRIFARDPMKNLIKKTKNTKEPKEPKSIKELEHAIRKEKKQDFMDLKDDLKEDPFEQFVKMQSPEHPLTANLEAVRTEAKEQEIIVPEKKVIIENAEKEKIDLEEQAKTVAKLMEDEGLSEDEAVEKVINDNMVIETPKIEVEERDNFRFVDKDIFKQDQKHKSKYPKFLRKLEKHFAKKKKKVFKWNLNALGIERRNEYADQIELKLNNWTFPLRKYNGKNQEFQKEEGEIKSDLKKFALFLSMGELMKDKEKKKKMYWEKIQVTTE